MVSVKSGDALTIGVLAVLLAVVLPACQNSPSMRVAADWVIPLPGAYSSVNLNLHARWLHSDNIDILETPTKLARQHELFHPPNTSGDFGRQSGWTVLHVQIHSQADTDQEQILTVQYSPLDQIHIHYGVTNSGTWQSFAGGDSVPAAQRHITHPHTAFPIKLAALESTDLFIAIKSATRVFVPVRMHTAQAFLNAQTEFGLWQGLYYGIILALVLYNLILNYTLKDADFGFYAGYLASIGGLLFTLEGYAALLFWPGVPWLADRAPLLLVVCSCAFGIEFARRIVDAPQYAPKHDKIMRHFWLAYVPALLLVVFTSTALALYPVLVLAVATVILITHAIVLAIYQGSIQARYVAIAYFSLLPGATILLARQVGYLQDTPGSQYALHIGTAVEAILLSLVLAYKYARLRTERAQAIKQQMESEKQANVAQTKFSRQLIATQDFERRRIASELHDGTAQNLTVLAGLLGRIPTNAEDMTLANKLVTESLADLRRLSSSMHPYLLDQLGLESAIEAVCERVLGPANISYSLFGFESSSDIAEPAIIHCYRIVQECVSNIRSHSGAQNCSIRLAQKNEYWQLSVSDDGQFRTDTSSSGGLGLKSIQERAALLGGELQFQTRTEGQAGMSGNAYTTNPGTTLTVVFPVS